MTASKLDQSWDDICERYEAGGKVSLSEAERDVQCLSWFRYQVGNGAMVQFFYNPWVDEDQLEDTMAALQRIGAAFAARAVRDVAALFKGGVPFDVEQRNAAMLSWPEGGREDAVLVGAWPTENDSLEEFDRLWHAFLLREGFCDPEDLEY